MIIHILIFAFLYISTNSLKVALACTIGSGLIWYIGVLHKVLKPYKKIHRFDGLSGDLNTSKGSFNLFTSSLQIANETLPFLRRGLNEKTARQTAEIIQKITDLPAVAVTDRQKVLAFLGIGCEKHPPGRQIVTRATKEVIATGRLKVVKKKEDFHCPHTNECDCPLEAAVIAPLKCKNEVVGTVKLYQTTSSEIPSHVIRLAEGIAKLLGVQMELADLDRQSQLVTKAKLDALQAQINPHFLFNTLNTISMFIRTDPEMARQLLKKLAAFLRHALKFKGHLVTLKEELEYLDNYLILEKARFGDKLVVKKEIDEKLLKFKLPVLTIQPLVENAIRHGIIPKTESGTVKISAKLADKEIHIAVHDDGVGIKPEILPEVLKPGFGSGSGVGLSNVHERLKILFGEEYGVVISSTPGEGTSVFVRIPLILEDTAKEGAFK